MIEINDILDAEKYLDGIELVLFDLDDTLYSEKEYVKSGFDALAKSYPQIQDFSNKLWNAFLNGEQAIDYVLKNEGLIKEKENCLTIYRNHTPNIHLYPGVREMLARIKQTKKIGIITDGRPEGQRLKLKALGLDNEKFIITDELGGAEYRKPCDKAFVLMKHFFDIEYRQIIYIGDNIKKDFIASEKLGMKCVWFRNKEGLQR